MVAENQREYLRILDSVEVRFRVVGAEEASALGQHRRERPSIHDIALIRALEEASRRVEEEGGLSLLLLHKMMEIDQKINALTRELGRKGDDFGGWRVAQTVNLSAGGVALPAMEGFDDGDFVDLTMHLPTFPPLTVRALGRIVRAATDPAPSGEHPMVGIVFEGIHEEDREMIYHYIFQRQREQIRQASRRPSVGASSGSERSK